MDDASVGPDGLAARGGSRIRDRSRGEETPSDDRLETFRHLGCPFTQRAIGRLTMRGDRRLTAVAQIAFDVVIVLLAAYILTIPAAAIVAIVLGLLFARWWQRTSGG